MKLTSEQIEKIKLCYLRWQGTVAPCGINHVDVYNPCLPEDLGRETFLLHVWTAAGFGARMF